MMRAFSWLLGKQDYATSPVTDDKEKEKDRKRNARHLQKRSPRWRPKIRQQLKSKSIKVVTLIMFENTVLWE